MLNSLSHTKHLIEAQKCATAHKLRTTALMCQKANLAKVAWGDGRSHNTQNLYLTFINNYALIQAERNSLFFSMNGNLDSYKVKSNRGMERVHL